jgi:3-phenylpropionate/cinnamic acid dioxygenase small subunit
MSTFVPLRRFELRAEIEDFYYTEAQLLDERRFPEWLDLLTDDLVYFMPLRRNVKFGQHATRIILDQSVLVAKNLTVFF